MLVCVYVYACGFVCGVYVWVCAIIFRLLLFSKFCLQDINNVEFWNK